MSTPMDRIKQIETLDATRIKGARARQTREMVEDVLAKAQDRYMKELIARTRGDGAVYEAAVYKIVAISDIVQDLDNIVGRGERAAKKLNNMQQTGDGN